MDQRDHAQGPDVIAFGPFSLHRTERQLTRGDAPVSIGARAFDLLVALVERAGEIVSQRDLIARVWPNVTVEDANLRVHIAGLRRALQDGRTDARYIVNVPGRGYSFVAPLIQPAPHFTPPDKPPAVAEQHPKLPPRPARMIGRDDTVRLLCDQLMTHRFVSVVGPGGMGKTTVAISVAHALLDEFDGAVCFIDLGTVTAPELVPAAAASALGLLLRGRDPVLSLLAVIRDEKRLLILDNCEHVIDAAAGLAERLLSEAPQLHLLTTSREALRAGGEHVHALYALDCPPEHAALTAAEVLRYPAAQLFVQHAMTAGLGAAPSDADAPSIATICRRLDGIALAIELAASCAGLHGIAETAQLLNNRFRLLWQGRRTALPRHQTLNALLDWSYNLLSEAERRVLCRLSVFVGDFTLDVASEVAADAEAAAEDGDVTGLVTSLVAKSLISTRLIENVTYYRLLDTTRTYAAAKLDQRSETGRVARRHAAAYCRLLQDEQFGHSVFDEHDLSGFSLHTGNVRAALQWALSHQEGTGVGIALAVATAPLLVDLSLLDECRHWCERALAVLGEDDRGSRKEMVLQEAFALSSMFTQGNHGEVRAAIDRGLDIANTLQDPVHQLRLLAGLNIYLTRIGDFRGALAIAEAGRQAALTSGSPAGIVMSDWMLGVSHHLCGNQTAAQQHCEAGLRYAIQSGRMNANFFGYDHRVRALVALARALWLRGSFEQALATAQQAIDEAAIRDHPVSVCIALIYGSTVFLWSGEFTRTEQFIDRLAGYAERHSLAPYRAVAEGLKAQLAIARGETDGSLELLRDTLETLSEEQHNILLTTFAASLAQGLMKTGHLEEALLTIDGAIRRAAGCGVTYHMTELLRRKAEILEQSSPDGRAQAISCLHEGIGIAREQAALALELRATLTLAGMLSQRGQQDQARIALADVCGKFPPATESADLRAARRAIAELT